MQEHPRIFVSATSADLRSCRATVSAALLTLGCLPVEQATFPPEAASVRDMLRKRIASCRAVVHVAGVVYGAEPQVRSPDEPRRSYTQMEVDIARELGKPLYVFVCGDGFPYDPHEPEDPERQALQQQHRRQLLAGDHLFTSVSSREELEKRVLALQARVEVLVEELARERARNADLGTVVRQQASELDQQRKLIESVMAQFAELQAQLLQSGLALGQIRERAVAAEAAAQGVSPAVIDATMEAFAERAGNADASLVDRARAAWTHGRYEDAARLAYLAVDECRARSGSGEASAAALQADLREALLIAGHSLLAAKRWREACRAYEQVLTVVSREADATTWAHVQFSLACVLAELSRRSRGSERSELRRRSIACDRRALEVWTRESSPQRWARAMNNLSLLLHIQAREDDIAERSMIRAEAIRGFEAVLQVVTREAFPDDWGLVEGNFLLVLFEQAQACEGAARAELLSDAVVRGRLALDGLAREKQPVAWAMIHNNIAIALCEQGRPADGQDPSGLLAAAVQHFRMALEVRTREADRREWAMTIMNLGNCLCQQAWGMEDDERGVLVEEAIRGFRSALEVTLQDEWPTEWAAIHDSLGIALGMRANLSVPDLAVTTLADAIRHYELALEVRTREHLPVEWAMTRANLAFALRKWSRVVVLDRRPGLLADAAGHLFGVLSVVTPDLHPQMRKSVQSVLAETLSEHADASDDCRGISVVVPQAGQIDDWHDLELLGMVAAYLERRALALKALREPEAAAMTQLCLGALRRRIATVSGS